VVRSAELVTKVISTAALPPPGFFAADCGRSEGAKPRERGPLAAACGAAADGVSASTIADSVTWSAFIGVVCAAAAPTVASRVRKRRAGFMCTPDYRMGPPTTGAPFTVPLTSSVRLNTKPELRSRSSVSTATPWPDEVNQLIDCVVWSTVS
jgi:hypothetical protein